MPLANINSSMTSGVLPGNITFGIALELSGDNARSGESPAL